MPGWSWIPLVLAAAAAQTVRNAAQRNLTSSAGTLPATFLRFFYGLPFAITGYLLVLAVAAGPLPRADVAFLASIAYRGGTRALGDIAAPVAGTYAVVWGQAMQSVVLGAYL